MKREYLLSTLVSICMFLPMLGISQPDVQDGEWPIYARDTQGTRLSTCKQITVKNVKKLQRVWNYQTGDIAP